MYCNNLITPDEMDELVAVEKFYGDINIGVVVPASRETSNLLCNPKTSIPRKIFIEYVYFLRKTINDINKNKVILPNVRLGYVFMDSCTRQTSALKNALKLIPRVNNQSCEPNNIGMSNYDVQVVIAGSGSTETAPISNILSRFSIPHLAPFASSDDLSDKVRYEYFSRLISPDKYQADALTDLLLEFHWNYISLVYIEGSYGENGAKQLRKQAKRKSICIAVDEMISIEDVNDDLTRIVKKLKENKKARVIVAFIFVTVADQFYSTMNKYNIINEKIIVASDSLTYVNTPSTDKLRAFNSFGVTTISNDPKGGYEYFSGINPAKNPSFLLIKKYWSDIFDCSWSNETNDDTGIKNLCDPNANFTLANVSLEAGTEYIDCLLVFVQAIDRIIKRNCPNATGKDVKNCVNGKAILKEIRTGTFETSQGNIEFDEKGDVIGGYNLVQYLLNNDYRVIGTWSRKRSGIDFLSNISWSDSDQPKSICSEPCPPKHYFIQKAVICCWDCRKCRNNEILILNKTSCKECPENYWPDKKGALECLLIDPDYLKWSDSETIVLLSIAGSGICFYLIIVFFIFTNKDKKLIKASSLQLSSIILLSILLNLITVILFLLKPSTIVCSLRRYLFSLSNTLIYAPIIMKTNRVYRIFTSARKGIKAIKFSSNRSQLIFVFVIVTFQVKYIINKSTLLYHRKFSH